MKRFSWMSWKFAALAGFVSASMWAAPAAKPFPAHWGEPPKLQTRDYVPLPGGYGHGSSTLAKWITARMKQDQAGGAPAGAGAAALYRNDFAKAEPGKAPEDFLVLNGVFTVKQVGDNPCLESPAAPADDYAALFGPAADAGLAVTASVYGTKKGRRYPVLAVGLNGVGGYELQLAPAKQALELFQGDTRVARAPCRWESGTWTRLRLQVRRVAADHWKVEGKAWKADAPEPDGWMIDYDTAVAPPAGRPLLSGHPYSGTPIRFDDLVVSPAADQ